MANEGVSFVCDEDDLAAIYQAVGRRLSMPMPDGDGSLVARVIAEICRGWQEMLDCEVSPSPQESPDDASWESELRRMNQEYDGIYALVPNGANLQYFDVVNLLDYNDDYASAVVCSGDTPGEAVANLVKKLEGGKNGQ